MKYTLALALLVAAAASAACDRLATGSFKPPYVTIAGQIDGSTATTMPHDVRVAIDPNMSWAVGTLVVFADNDKSGDLTITSPGDPPSPDRVLAADLDILFL